ncbi:MAG: hypothetical protein CEO12_214 [Parcubacteria group bacterium Gr01-1014_46]|nr:MAG: hypothetical protein CEO12_214 [Parcubacteria group bacterium Gr01-1014_46]
MKNLLKNHWLVFLSAFVIGLIIFLPNITSIIKTGDKFSGIYPMFNDDESYYLAITKEVYEGSYNSGNTFIKEYKNSPALQPLYFETIPAFEAKLFGISVPEAFVLNDLILPLLGVILLYIILFSITESRLISNIFSFSFYFIFLGVFNRPISPQLGFVFLLVGVFLIWKTISKSYELEKFLILNSLLGFVFGLLVYVYPFYWTTLIVLYGVSSLLVIFKERQYLYWVKGYFVFSLVSLLIHLPYILNVLKIFKDPSLFEASVRNGLVLTHWPGAFFNTAFILFCFPIVYLLTSHFSNKRHLIFSYALIISGVVLNWQNIITGQVLQFSSHYYLITIFFIFLIISIVLKNLLSSLFNQENLSYKKWLAIAMSATLLLVIIYKQKNDIVIPFKNIVYPPDITELQRISPALDWLNKNTETESVVYGLGGKYDVYVPIYTNNNVYLSWYTGMSLIPDNELENRWVIQHFWDDIDPEFVNESHRSIWINKFQDTYANKEVRRKIFEKLTGNKYPENVLLENKYVDTVLEKSAQYKKAGFEKSLKTYEVNYVILDTKDDRYKNLADKFKKYSFLLPMVEKNGFIVYKVE